MENEILKVMTKCEGLPMCVTLAGITNPDPNYHIHRNKARETVMEYVTHGAGYITVNGVEHRVTADKIYILKKGIEHNYRVDPEEPWRKIFVNITGDLPIELMQEYGLDRDWFFDGEGLLPFFREIEDIVTGDLTNLEAQSILTSVFLQVLTALSLKQSSDSHHPEAVKMKEYIDNGGGVIISNTDLAKHIYRSPDYCVKLFSKEYGTTPYDYQLRVKMSTARRLLRNTAMSIGDIAASLGYGDARYFSGLFKKKCGVSPLKYRKTR